jgi:acyl-CoA-binding protein
MSVTLINPRAVPGDNQPPSPIESGKVAVTDLSRFLAEHPVIQTEDEAREGKLFVDRMRATLGEIEDTRIALTKPLNDELDKINATYKSVHNTDKNKPGTFDKIFNELKARLTAFAKAEEARKEALALEAKRVRDEAEREALEAEQRERDAIENARAGELGVDVTQVVVEADSRFNTFKQADRAAARAEREINTRIGGGFSGRAIGLRSKETLVLESYNRAIKAIGPNAKIEEAILSAARDYRKTHGDLPDGVTTITERTI